MTPTSVALFMSKYNRSKTGINQLQDDSDDDPTNESFILFGTEFPEPTEKERRQGIEDPGKFQPVWNQQVTDEKGRRRFHGAFTGGFSAGYYNSVGSKEGWQPSTFVSSRSTRQENMGGGARPEDFMDEEDLEEIANARKLVATEEFDLIGGTERDLARRQELDKRAETEGGLLGAQAFQDFVVPSKDPIGVKLLRRMGWKPGQGVGARISAAKRRKLALAGSESGSESEEDLDANISFAPRDSAIIVFAQKRDTFGLGFDPYKNVPDISDIKQARAERSIGESSTEKRTDYNKAGFGIGVLDDDDDDDVYTNFSRTTYSHELKDEYDIEERIIMGKRPKPAAEISGSCRYNVDRANTKHSGHDGRAALHGFAYGKQDALQEKWFPPAHVPANFEPFHVFKDSGPVPAAKETEGRQQKPDMSFEERGNLLGEKPIAPRSVFEYVSSKSKDSLDSLLSGITRSTSKVDKSRLHEIPRIDKKAALTALRGFLPFGETPKKQARYRAYLEGQAGLLQDDGSPITSMDIPEGLSYDEAMKELDDFGKAARIFRPISGMMSSRFTSASETVSTSVQPNEGGLKTETQWKKEKERREELEKEKSRSAPKIESQETQAAAMKMFGQLTRTTKPFYPSRLVCKRFNVKNPHPDQQADDAAGRRTQAGGKQPLSKESVSSMMNKNTLDEFTIPSDFSNDPTLQAVIPKPSERSPNEQVGVEKNMTEISSKDTEEKEDKPLDYERPSMDIFKAIFENSDDEDEVEDEDEDVKPVISDEKPNLAAVIGSALDRDSSNLTGIPMQQADDDSMIGPPLPPPEQDDKHTEEMEVTMSKPVFRPMFKKRTHEGSNKDDRSSRHLHTGPMSFASEEHIVEPFSNASSDKASNRHKNSDSRHGSDDAAESSGRPGHHHKRDSKKKKRKTEQDRSDSREKRHKRSKKRRRDRSEDGLDKDDISDRLIYDDSLWVEKPPVAPPVTQPTKSSTRPKAYDMW